MRVSILLILTVLVVLSIGFEYFKDKVEESTTDAMEPIVTHFWQGKTPLLISVQPLALSLCCNTAIELTVLGFLSLLSFLAVKAKLLVALSKQLFDEDEKLPEVAFLPPCLSSGVCSRNLACCLEAKFSVDG